MTVETLYATFLQTNNMKNNSLILLLFSALISCSNSLQAAKTEVFVSILPQQYFVERIGGDQVNVNVMVKPGQSPETFEPSPRLMSLFSKADVYFTIGMPFEQVWIDRVASLNQSLSIMQTQPKTKQITDPHSWLSPVLVIAQAHRILTELIRLSPENKELFYNNYKELEKELNVLHDNISSAFKTIDKHRFMTFHPAFFYFAELYGLTQIAIEVEGKEPSAKQMAKLLSRYQKQSVSYLLIEKQFNQVIPGTIAKSLNAELLTVDPLAKDYLTNMTDIAEKIKKALF